MNLILLVQHRGPNGIWHRKVHTMPETKDDDPKFPKSVRFISNIHINHGATEVEVFELLVEHNEKNIENLLDCDRTHNGTMLSEMIGRRWIINADGWNVILPDNRKGGD